MADYNGAGSLYALGVRLAKLQENGAPLQGALASYVTDALIKIELGLEYEEGEEVTVKNGAGVVCLSYRAPDTLKRGTISGFQVCTPDPNVKEFLIGGTVIDDNAGDAIGYGAPQVGVNPTPNGVSVEVWTRGVTDGALSGYYRWAIPRAFLALAGNLVMSQSDPLTPEFEGFCTQNPNWGDGPANDWLWLSDRVWQYVQVATLPDLARGFRTVGAELTVTTVTVLPATANLDASDQTTQQLSVTATMSDASVRNVTDLVTYVSDTPAIATVTTTGTDRGLIRAVAAGSAIVTATYGGQIDTCAVTVVA